MPALKLVAGFAAPAWANYELPPGERITNLPHIPRAMPQKEAYESYDPAIGKNFDIKNFWMRADLRVRPEFRKNTCFGSNIAGGACNAAGSTTGNSGLAGKPANAYADAISTMTLTGVRFPSNARRVIQSRAGYSAVAFVICHRKRTE